MAGTVCRCVVVLGRARWAMVCQGSAGRACSVKARSCAVCYGEARQAWYVMARKGTVWHVKAGHGRHVLACWGKAVRGEVLLGVVWQVWQVKVAQVGAWSGVAGELCLGRVRIGWPRQGGARPV